MYREEYPRPNFIRPDWQSLNGKWDFEIADGTSRGLASYLDGGAYADVIEVPFSPQSPLSGIGKNENFKSVWYRRSFTIAPEKLEGTVLLNFGAVDFRAEVYVNGAACAGHRGGYTPFTADITNLVAAGENTLVVNALDDDTDPFTPSGVQGKDGFPHCSGIWQSVWLEFASKTYISAYRATPVPAQKAVIAQGFIQGAEKGKITAEVFLDGKSLAKYNYELKQQFFIKIPIGDNLTLWEVGEGKFYDIALTLYDGQGVPLDSALTYAAFRHIEIKDKKIFLNGKPITVKQTEDYRYYPEGHYTAPSEAAIKQDLVCAAALGFNSVRVRRTLAEPYYLYHADRMGMLLFEEYPSADIRLCDTAAALWFSEWQSIIERDFGNPSIIFWLPVGTYSGENGDFVNRICSHTAKADPSRPIADGALHYNTAIFDKPARADDSEGFLAALYNVRNGGFTSEKEAVKAAKQNLLMLSDTALAELPLFVSNIRLPREAYADTRTFKRYFAAYVNAVMVARAAGFCFGSLFDTPSEDTGYYNDERDFKFERGAETSIRKFLEQIR